MWKTVAVVLFLVGCNGRRVEALEERQLELAKRIGELEARVIEELRPGWWCSKERCERKKFEGAEATTTAWCAGAKCVPTLEQCTEACVGVR